MLLDNNTRIKTSFYSGIVFQILYISFCCVCYILIYIVMIVTLNQTCHCA